MNSSNQGLFATLLSIISSIILVLLASSFSGPSEQVAGCVGWAFGLVFGSYVHENASSVKVKALALVFAAAIIICVVVNEGFILLGIRASMFESESRYNMLAFSGFFCCTLITEECCSFTGGFVGWILGCMAGAGIASMKLCGSSNFVESANDVVVEPGRFAGVSMALVCDLFGMLSLVLKGRRRALTPDDFNPATPTSFTLAYGPAKAVADQIDGAAAAVRAVQASKASKTSRWPLLVQMALRERRALLLTGIVFGVVHGVINSVRSNILSPNRGRCQVYELTNLMYLRGKSLLCTDCCVLLVI